MQHIETIELTSSQASFTFSSIPQDYDDLVLLMSLRTDNNRTDDDSLISFNSSTSNLSIVRLFGNSSSVLSIVNPPGFAGFTTAASTQANTFSSQKLYISNYTRPTEKAYSVDNVTENNVSFASQDIAAGLWGDTAAVNSITITMAKGTNFIAGSTASLYGVTAGGSGTVTTA